MKASAAQSNRTGQGGTSGRSRGKQENTLPYEIPVKVPKTVEYLRIGDVIILQIA